MADKERQRPVAPQTQFEIASETMTFTAAVLAKRITGTPISTTSRRTTSRTSRSRRWTTPPSEPRFADVVQRELTGPLGMTGTIIESPTPDLAVPYANGSPTDLWNNTGALAGGGLISTASDMAKWVAATLGYGGNPLVPVLQSTLDPIPGVAPTTMPNMQMGMAWQLYPAQNGIDPPYAFKDGGASGTTSATYLVPSEGWGVTVMANGDSTDTDSVAFELMRELAPDYPAAPEDGSGSLSFGSLGS